MSTPTPLVLLIAADSLVRIPLAFSAHLMANEEDDWRKQLRRLSTDKLQIALCREPNAEALAKATIVVLTSHVDLTCDGGGIQIASIEYLRAVLNYEGPILTVCFSRSANSDQSLPDYEKWRRVTAMKANRTWEQVMEAIYLILNP